MIGITAWRRSAIVYSISINVARSTAGLQGKAGIGYRVCIDLIARQYLEGQYKDKRQGSYSA
jgi:hypothetical protein